MSRKPLPGKDFKSQVSVSGRELHMSRTDIHDFLIRVAEALPEVRYFDFGQFEDGQIVEVPREAPWVPDRFAGKLKMYFVGPDWEPRIVRTDQGINPYYFANQPLPLASISAATFHTIELEEVGRPITWIGGGLLNASYFRNQPEGRRVIDKVFRIHRKLAGNKAVPVDLRTGDVAGEVETVHYWHGQDMARQCRQKKDHYLFVRLDRENDRFWGYKPVRVPGEE